MAVKDCDKVSNIIAVAIAAGDDDISNVVASLSKIKNDALQRSRALRESWETVDTITWYTPYELELRASSADIKIRAIVQASILKWDKGNEAFTELARQIKKTKGSIAWGVNLLEMVHNAPMADYQEIARLWDNTMDVSEALKDLNDWLSEFISSNYSIRAYSDFYEWEVASAKKAFKDKKINEKEYEKRIKNAHKEVMNKIAKWENPTGFVPLDNEWQAIKKVYWDDPKMAWRAWSQYIMAREFLADWGLDEDLLKAFEFWWEELLWDLTSERIVKCEDLDQLLARAFTNTEQLYRDGALRAVYRDKLSELASWEVLTEKNAKKMRTLVNVSLFAEEWATLSDVLLDNRAYTSMKDMGFKVTERQWSQIYNDLRNFAKAYNNSIEKWEVGFWDTATKIAGQEVQPKDILQLIYDITWDKNILALVEAWNFSDWAILNMATQKLLWDNEKAKTALIKLFKKGKEWNKITNSRWVFLRAITWLEVPDWANIAFFDYRRWLYYKDELSSAKADFMDKLAEKNKMRVVSDWIEDLTMLADATDENVQLLVQQLKDKNIAWGFIIVNDSAYKDNPLLRKALDQFADDDSITVLYPRGWLWANFSMEDWSIFYKTIYDDTYDNVAWRISIQSMWEAKPTREMLASAYEAQTWRNWDKLRYQASYNDWGVDSLGRQISDQQVEYFAKSVVRDKNGNLTPVYHWRKNDFDIFSDRYSDEFWFHFWSTKTQAKARAWKWWEIIEVYLNIKNPIVIDTDFWSWTANYGLWDWLEGKWIISAEEAASIKKMEDRTSNRYLKGLLLDRWYDWIVYKNLFEWGGQNKSYKSYIVFNSNQIKYVDNRLPTADPNMHFMEREMLEYVDPATWIKYELLPRDYRELFDRGKEVITEFVPIKELDKLKEYDRRLEPKWDKADSDKTIDELKESFQTEWIRNPIKISYSLTDWKAYISEWNHRLAAAKELWMEYFPAQVYVLKSTDAKTGIKMPSKPEPFWVWNYYPDSMAPSEIWIKWVISTPNPNMHFMEREFWEPTPQWELSAIDAWNARVKAARESWDYTWADDYQLIKDYYDNMKNFLSQFEPAELEKLKKYSKVRMNVSDVEWWAKKNWIAVEYLTAFTELIPLQGIHNSKIFTDISFPKYYEAVWDWAKYAHNIDDVALRWGFTWLPTTDPNIRFMEREFSIDSPEAIKQYVYADLDESRIWDVIDFDTLKLNKKKFNKLTKEEKIQILNRVWTFSHMYELEWWARWFVRGMWTNSLYNDLYDTILNSEWLSEYLIKEIDWQDLSKFVSSYTDEWMLPYEVMFYVDDNGKVSNAVLWFAWNVAPIEQILKEWGREFHNHPNGSWFSPEDIAHAKQIVDDWYPVKSVWLILPWWVMVEYELTDDFFDYVRTDIIDIYSTIREAVDTAELLWTTDKQTRWKFQEVIDKMDVEYSDDLWRNLRYWNDEALETLNRISNEVKQDSYNRIRNALTPEWAIEPVWMRRFWQYSDQADMPITDALKVQMFTKDRTWEQIANGYGFSIEYVHWTDMIQWVKAYWAYWNGVIYFTDIVKESTPPHELFHWIFNMYVKGQDPDMYERVLRDSAELFWVSEYKAEEILADSFAERFRTWEFTYWEKLKREAEEMLAKEWKIKKKGLNKEQKSLVAQILEYFKEIARQLWILDNHRAEVKQMFEDMVNMKYLPDAWKPVSAADAMVRYNDELNKAAVKYFWQVLWESSEVVDSEYIRRVETLLSDMLWMDIKTFNTFKDNSELWRRIDKELTLERLTTWRFDKEIVDIKKVRDDIANMSDEELAKSINEKFWVLVRWWTIEWNENISLIREAWFDYNTAKDTTDLLSAKWKIVSLVNWANAQTVSIDDIKTMFQNKTFADKYKELFFPEQALNDKDMELFIRQINSDLFDWLSIQFAENLVKAGYSLPLVNVKRVVYDYLNNSLDLNSDFVQAFFYKNNIPYTKDNLDTIMTTLMPKEFSFDFDVLKWRLYDDSLVWNVSTVVESPNRFLPDSYSALYAIEDSWKGITLWNKEYDVLVWMVDKYIDAVLKWMSEWTLKFWDAQTLKAELSYAMDTFEQDFIMPKYWTFLTPQDRQTILGMKYTIPIWVTWQPINEVEKMLNAWRIRLLWDWKTTKWEFRRVLWTMVDNADINAAIAKGYNKAVTPKELQERIERRRNQLITNWSTIKEINWEYVVYDSKDALWETINSLPDNIEWLAWLKAMSRDEIENMTNKQAYILLRYLEAAKSLSATADYATQLMYKQSPQLAQYSFFSTYVVDPETWLPRIMKNNSLNVDEFFNNIAGSVTADDAIKKDIFTDIVNKFRKDGYVLAHSKKDANGKIIERWLDDMISSAVTRQVDELQSIKLTPENTVEAKNKMQNIYTNMFIPYTYLKDIPDWGYIRMLGSAQNVVPLEDVKKKVETTMKEAYTKAIEDLKAAWATDADKIQQVITIRLNDWERLTLADLANQNIDSWKRQIFNDQSIFVRGADEDWEFVVDETETLAKQQEIKKEEKEYRERIQNSYLSSLQTILNEWQSVSDAERELMTSFMLDVRTDLRKYDLTSKLVDALDALSWINEEVARWIKNYLIWFGWTVTFGKYKPGDILERYKLVRDAYKGYYDMSLEQLMKAAPKNHAEEVAWNAARYFKNLERLLGSVDWVQWVTTSKETNKAFYHLWEVFMNLNTNPQSTEWVRWIFSMLSAIEQNQPLKFFKFSEPWQASYYKPFKQNPAWKDRWLDGLWGYRDYVETINNITREDFNKLFGANYSDEQFKRVLQGLSWFSLTWGWLWRKVNKIMDIMNGSWLAFRFAMSYPWQLLTIPLQGVAYFLKQLWHELKLGIEDLATVDDIREQFWILDWAYNELNIFGKLNFNPDSKDVNSFYNRYWIPDIKEFYKDTWITAADDYVNMYAKLDAKYSKPDKIMNAIRWFDPYKDNANNFVDWVFARNFKNIAFVKWLKDNDFMKFSTAEDFLAFMNDATINAEVKSKLLDSVAASAGRNFRNILWLGFGWIDRAIWAKQRQNILFWAMQMFNFRWSWWQNIVKQTGANITHLLQWAVWWTRLSKPAREEVVKFIANSPEYVNFMTSLMTDLEWAFKLTRYQDNGRWPDEDKDGIYYFLDYLSFMWENMNMVSQRWQWLQSYWPLRPLQEQWQSILRSQMDPTVYQDTYWLWALFNAIGKNFLRQWKPINWLTELVWAYESWWPENARAFITNRFFNLSFWSLRYMVNEDENAYGYTYEVTWQYGWIPSIVMGEAQMGSDKSFTYELDNNETWKNLELFFFEDIPWSQKKVYWGNLWSALVNGSQFASALKNSIKVVTGKYSKSFFTSEDLAWTLKKTSAGRELYEKWYVTPRTNAEASIFMKTILNNSEYRPGSSSFNKSLINFEDFWHMAWEKWKEADSGMELWLEHMKYQTDWHWEFIKKDWQRVIDPGRTALITNVKTYYWNEDYVTSVIYNYAKDWLDIHNSDPNYSMYMKMLWQWQAHMILENEIKKRVKEKNIWLSKDWKWNQTNFNQAEYRDMLLEIGGTVLEWDNMTFFDKLNRLDIDDATLAAIRIIEKQSTEEDRKEIEKFFVPKTDEKDDDIVEELELKPQYQSVLKQIANIGRAMDEGNVERVIATASSLTNLYKEDDPTGVATASIINSIFNRIYQAPNLTPEQKQEMMIWVFYDNKDFIQRSPEKMRELLWDNYDAYADLMNEMIYKWDGQVISNLESLQSSWTGSKASTAKGRKLSNNLKSISLSNWSKWGWTTKTGKRAWHGYWEWVPVVIKWADLVKQLWLKGYSPLNVKKTIFEYTPHADFSLRKDVNRNVKGPKTETISTKKQLSNLESKATKALEAES